MEDLMDIYYKGFIRNEHQLQFWQNTLQNLQSLDFSIYADKLKVPVLVPIGNAILFRGEFRQTNEVTFRVGNEYLIRCSANQAEEIRQHRIKAAQLTVDTLLKEREAYQQQTPFIPSIAFQEKLPEIFEEVSEEEDLKWRKQHRENLREYKQRSKTERPKEQTSDEELWRRLEELELQEELDVEVNNLENEPKTSLIKMPFKKSDSKTTTENLDKEKKEERNKASIQNNKDVNHDNIKSNTISPDSNGTLNPKHTSKGATVPKDNNKVEKNVKAEQNDLKNKQNELKDRLADKSKSPAQSIMDLLTRLDEMEQLEDVEDEMARLGYDLEDEDVEQSEDEDVEQSEDEDVEQSEDEVVIPAGEIKRSVSFADDKRSKTLQVKFRHSRVKPDTTPYDEAKGITKPSDIYAAFSHLCSETKSILKKSKYERDYTPSGPRVGKRTKVDDFQEAADNRRKNKTIVLKDVVERVELNDNKFKREVIVENDDRPLSVFKKRRQQNR